MPKDSPTEPIAAKTPVQKRSRATLERIHLATAQLLKTQRYSEISIVDIAKSAKCGVGTLYGRFKNKDALLTSLEARVVRDIQDRQGCFVDSRDWTEVGFEERVSQLVQHIAEGYRIHGSVLRELVGRVHQNSLGASHDSSSTISKVFRRDVEFLLESLGQVNRRRLRKAIGLALMAVVVTLQNRMLQTTSSPVDQVFSENYLKTEMPKMVIAYVRAALEE